MCSQKLWGSFGLVIVREQFLGNIVSLVVFVYGVKLLAKWFSVVEVEHRVHEQNILEES